MLSIVLPTLIGGAFVFSLALAQTSPFDWSVPQRITERQELTSEPILVADQSGLLHLFWSPVSSDSQSIYYSVWNGSSWTQPVDILSNFQIIGPTAAVDSKGNIYLVFSDGTSIYYSQSLVGQAISAANWSKPIAIINGLSHAQILTDTNDRLYIFFPGLSSTGPKLITSEDGGDTWSDEISISLTSTPDRAADYVRAAISVDGTIHVVWTEYQLPQGWPPLGLYYAHSNDGGDTWSRPVELAGEFYNQVNITTFGDRIIHTAWNGAAGTGGRYYRWSQDGGDTWSSVTAVIPAGNGGSEGPPQLAVDNLGTLHMITTYNQRVWYLFVQGPDHKRWSNPIYIPTGDESGIPPIDQTIDPEVQRHIEHPTMTISAGNQLQTVFWDERPAQQILQFWYTTKQTSASSSELISFPTQTATSTMDYKSTETVTDLIMVTPSPPLIFSTDNTPPSRNTGMPIVVSAILVVILIGSVVGLQIRRTKRK